MSDKKAHWGSQILQGATNLTLGLAGIACILQGVFVLWLRPDITAPIPGLAAGLIFLLASSIERFEVLKGLGVEARTRKLDAAISQANATLEQLRELAELSSEVIVSLNSKTGRWDSAPTVQEAYDTANKVKATLRGLGSSDAVITKTLAPWVRTTSLDQTQSLLNELRKPLLEAAKMYSAKLQNYPTPIHAGDPAYQHLLNEKNRFENFEKSTCGEVAKWPIGTHAGRLEHFVDTMPLMDESARTELKALLSPWLPRLERLATDFELQDKEAWIAASDR